MKKIIISLLAFISLESLTAQTHVKDALDLSSREINGTARYRALGSAMGALGEDISAISLSNPAGGAVSVRSHGSMTLGVNYYENEYNNLNNEKTRFNLTQIGGNFVFELPNANAKWKRIAFTLNYERNNILDKKVEIDGFNHELSYDDSYYYFTGNDREIDLAKGKVKYNGEELYVDGYKDQFSFGLSGNYDHRVFLGIGFNFHNSYKETDQVVERELISDNRGIDRFALYNLDGTGFSFSLGVIGKITDEIRLGISYQSPIWWNIEEDILLKQFIGDDPLFKTGDDPIRFIAEGYDKYDLRTPSRLTGSGAVVIGKKLAINADVIYQDYNNINFSGQSLYSDSETNERTEGKLRNTWEYRIGSEYRLDQISFRGGYRYVQDPYKDLKGSASIYSIGLGYNFGDIYFSGSYDYTDADTEYEIDSIRSNKYIKQNLTRSNFTFTIGYRF